MATRRDLWLLLPRQLRALPADLAAVTLGVGVALATVFLPIISETPLRVVFGLVFVLFLPGYAFVAALFPEAGTSSTETAPRSPAEDRSTTRPAPVPGTEAAAEATTDTPDSAPADQTGIDGIERLALSFGLSIAIVPLIGLVLNFTPWGIRLAPITVSVAGVTLACVAVAAQRRWALPADEQFAVPYREWLAAGRTELFEPESRTDAALNVVLILSLVLAISSVGYAVAVPPQGEQFTEFYLLTEQPDGELVADDYPTTMTTDEQSELIVGIGNNEYDSQEYTVIVQLQDVVREGNTTTVTNRTELDRFSTTVAHNETHHERRVLTPTRTGTDLRVQYLLYTDEPPATPTAETAYRELHLWLNVTDSQSTGDVGSVELSARGSPSPMAV